MVVGLSLGRPPQMRLADHYIILVSEHDRDYPITDLGHVNHSILAQGYHHKPKGPVVSEKLSVFRYLSVYAEFKFVPALRHA